jgi:hypothetical protein
MKKRKLSDNSIILINNEEETVSHNIRNKEKDKITKLSNPKVKK